MLLTYPVELRMIYNADAAESKLYLLITMVVSARYVIHKVKNGKDGMSFLRVVTHLINSHHLLSV